MRGGTGSSTGDGSVDRVVDAEHLGETGDLEHLQDAVLGADEGEVAVVATEPLEATDAHAEARGVEEVDTFQVDDDVVLALADQLHQPFAKPRRGVDVVLPTNSEDGRAAPLGDVETEIHACVP